MLVNDIFMYGSVSEDPVHDELKCKVVSTSFLIWKNQNINCQLKVKFNLNNLNTKSLN